MRLVQGHARPLPTGAADLESRTQPPMPTPTYHVSPPGPKRGPSDAVLSPPPSPAGACGPQPIIGNGDHTRRALRECADDDDDDGPDKRGTESVHVDPRAAADEIRVDGACCTVRAAGVEGVGWGGVSIGSEYRGGDVGTMTHRRRDSSSSTLSVGG